MDCNIIYKSVQKARALLKTPPATPTGMAAHLKKNEISAHNLAVLLIEESPLDADGWLLLILL